MGLYILKESEHEILGMNFEQILNYITEKPKYVFSIGAAEEEKVETDSHIYWKLKEAAKGFKGDQRFIMERLEQEFKDSLETAANASKQGRQAAQRKPLQ